mgnify:FL=1
MSRLQLQALAKSYGSRELFKEVSLELGPGDRLALIGSNGCGKSTLLRIIAQESQADAGRVLRLPRESDLGYGAQALDTAQLQTPLINWILEVLPSWSQLWTRWSRAAETGNSPLLEKLAEEQNRLEQVFGYNPEHKAKAVLTGLGFAPASFQNPLQSFSGGWQERAKLARVLVQGSDILLLDEPTNHLDLEAVRWLEAFLSSFKGVLVFVAHDRFFLDQVANRVLYMDPLKPIVFEGNFSRFLAWQQERDAALSRQRDKLQQAIDHKQSFVDRFRYKARKAAQAQSRVKQIKRLEQEKETLVQPRAKKSLDFSWPTPPRNNAVPVSGVDLTAPYPAGAPLFTKLSFQLRRGQKVALAGPNGCGKTTLLKIISAGLTPGAGSVHIGTMVSMASFSQQAAEMLDADKTVLSQIRALTGPGIKEQELASVLGLFLFGRDFWDQRIASLSGGEKSRLILASLFVSNANLLILDEPTNHLDIESREALIQALKLYRGTLLFVAHDRALLSEVAQEIWNLGPRGLDILHEGYQAYEHKMAANRQGPTFQEKGPEQLQRSKEQKRQDARTRNERFRLLKPLKNEYSDLETRFDALLQKMETVEQALAASETYTDGELVKRLNQEYRGHQQESESLLQQMETLEHRIDVIEKDQNKTLSG